jgi:hypothetical protein
MAQPGVSGSIFFGRDENEQEEGQEKQERR